MDQNEEIICDIDFDSGRDYIAAARIAVEDIVERIVVGGTVRIAAVEDIVHIAVAEGIVRIVAADMAVGKDSAADRMYSAETVEFV